MSLESFAWMLTPFASMIPDILTMILISFLNPSNSTGFDVLTLYSLARMAVVVFNDNLADGNLGSGGGGEDFLADAGGGVIFPWLGV